MGILWAGVAAPPAMADEVICTKNERGQIVCITNSSGSSGEGSENVADRSGRGGSAADPLPEKVLDGLGCDVVPLPAPCDVSPAAPAAAGGSVRTWTPGELAVSAASRLRLPVPVAGRSPDDVLADGRAATYVRLETWFFVPAAQWKPVKTTAMGGGLWATATATPAALVFDPGDGSAPVSCTGPGREWVYGVDRNFDRAPGGCSYAYGRSSAGRPGGMVTASYTIRWSVRWAGSGGTGGVLPDVTSTSTSRFAVAEAQAVTQ